MPEEPQQHLPAPPHPPAQGQPASLTFSLRAPNSRPPSHCPPQQVPLPLAVRVDPMGGASLLPCLHVQPPGHSGPPAGSAHTVVREQTDVPHPHSGMELGTGRQATEGPRGQVSGSSESRGCSSPAQAGQRGLRHHALGPVPLSAGTRGIGTCRTEGSGGRRPRQPLRAQYSTSPHRRAPRGPPGLQEVAWAQVSGHLGAATW